MSPYFGGDAGTFFNWNQFSADWHINKVKLRHAWEIDGIQVFASHVIRTSLTAESLYYGGQGGAEAFFTVDKGDWINKIEGRAGTRIDSLTFTTKNGKTTKFGGSGGTYFIVTPPT